jgi:hypothetical protein
MFCQLGNRPPLLDLPMVDDGLSVILALSSELDVLVSVFLTLWFRLECRRTIGCISAFKDISNLSGETSLAIESSQDDKSELLYDNECCVSVKLC